jgi:1,4-alpha-glucan branching enzyme
MRYSNLSIVALTVVLLMACNINKNNEDAMSGTRGHEEWSKNAVIYEVNIRQYSEEGTFEAFMPHIPRLKEMGVDILWLMPIHPVGQLNRKGSLGSYYAVKDYRGVNPEFGTMDDLRQLVQEAHKLGMKVILDWVANHTSWDNVWTKTNPEYFEKDEKGGFVSPYDWTDVVALDYNNYEMRDSMIEALKYWVKEADIDGYRCDVAGMVPTDFWDDARKALEAIKPVFMLAEDEDNPDLLRSAFDMNYTWKLLHLMSRIVKKESMVNEFWTHFAWNDSVFTPSVYRMNFITNHDENSWNGTEFERLGDGVEAFAVLSFMIPGMPLIYSGQEAGLKKRLRFFEKDTIDWTAIKYHDFYAKLINIKKEHKSLWNGAYGAPMIKLENSHPDQVISFARISENDAVLAIFNLSDKPVKDLKIKMTGLAGTMKQPFTGKVTEVTDEMVVNVGPWQYEVFVKI